MPTSGGACRRPRVLSLVAQLLLDPEHAVAFATRSLLVGAPDLIWPLFVATTRSAIVVSSVSPERWLTIWP